MSDRHLSLLCLLCLSACAFQPGRYSGSEPDADPAPSDAGALDVDGGLATTDAIPTTATTLSESTSSVAAAGHATYCNNGSPTLTRVNAWYRAYRPADFGIGGTFHVTRLRFTSEQTAGATVTATVYSYVGTFGTGSIDASKLTQLATRTGTVPTSSSPQALTATLAADIAPGATFVVEIRATDTLNSSQQFLTYFHLGANAAGETAPSYFQSPACGVGTPDPAAQIASVDFILDVEGTY